MSIVGQWEWREGEWGRSGKTLLIADIQSSRQMEYPSSETSLVNVLEEKESSGDSCISSSMPWCRSNTYHFSTHALAETSHTAPPNHEVPKKCSATSYPESGKTRSTWQRALKTTMQIKFHPMTRKRGAKLLSLFLSLEKYQPCE